MISRDACKTSIVTNNPLNLSFILCILCGYQMKTLHMATRMESQTKIVFEALNQPRKPPTDSDPPSTTANLQSSGTPAYTMATAINLPTFSEFELQPRNTAPTRLEKYVRCLKNMFTAMSINQESKKKAMLLHYVGPRRNLRCVRNSHRTRADGRE